MLVYLPNKNMLLGVKHTDIPLFKNVVLPFTVIQQLYIFNRNTNTKSIHYLFVCFLLFLFVCLFPALSAVPAPAVSAVVLACVPPLVRKKVDLRRLQVLQPPEVDTLTLQSLYNCSSLWCDLCEEHVTQITGEQHNWNLMHSDFDA